MQGNPAKRQAGAGRMKAPLPETRAGVIRSPSPWWTGIRAPGRRFKESSTEFRCCGCFASAPEALDAVPKLGARITLVGAVLPDCCGLKCVRELRARQPRLGIILASSTALDAVMVRRAVAAGANECCLKPLNAEQCLLLLRFMAARCPPEHPAVRLTARDEQILACLAKGLAYKEIEDKLKLSPALLKKLQHGIFVKLKAGNRTEAVNRWFGLTNPGGHAP
jgi:DNA-binding NarL/FixJ family response regulator